MIPSAGLTRLLEMMLNTVTAVTPYCAVGSGATAPAAGDTTLTTEITRVQAATVTVSGNVATIKTFFNTAQGNGSIAETGLLTLSSGGVLLEHSLETPAQVKASSQEMIVEYSITLDNA